MIVLYIIGAYFAVALLSFIPMYRIGLWVDDITEPSPADFGVHIFAALVWPLAWPVLILVALVKFFSNDHDSQLVQKMAYKAAGKKAQRP